MRSLRWMFASGLALVALAPAAGSAQNGRLFNDSWFWGVKAGGVLFSTEAGGSAAAPLIGGEWMITRSRGAVYLSLDQSFFNETSGITDRQGQVYRVSIENLRRFTVAALAFPTTRGRIRPYGGLGLAVNFIGDATARDTVPRDLQTAFEDEVDERRYGTSVVFMGGVQAQYRRASLFAQLSAAPPQRRFFVNNGTTLSLEGGVRYNIGSAIDRKR